MPETTTEAPAPPKLEVGSVFVHRGRRLAVAAIEVPDNRLRFASKDGKLTGSCALSEVAWSEPFEVFHLPGLLHHVPEGRPLGHLAPSSADGEG